MSAFSFQSDEPDMSRPRQKYVSDYPLQPQIVIARRQSRRSNPALSQKSDSNGPGRVEAFNQCEFLYTAAFLCGVVWWLNAEAGTSAVKRVYCRGLLVAAGWLIIIPYHLLKTRGVKGLIPLVALVGSFVIAYISALVVYMIFLS